MFSSKQPNDQISTAVVYNTSYGPAITRCIDTYSNSSFLTVRITYEIQNKKLYRKYYYMYIHSYAAIDH